jgi:hypothetical protein
MHTRLSAGLTMGLMLWTGAALAQGKPPCDQHGKVKTPERVAGEVTSVDTARGTVSVREADGTTHEFQASADTLRDVKVGGRVDAKLREAPKCS